MTNYFGVNNTLQYQSSPAQKAGLGEYSGRLRVLWDSYTLGSGSLTTSDTLFLMKIPGNARVMDAVVVSADLGGTGTMNIGWQAGATGAEAAAATGFYSALDLSGQAVIASLVEVASASGAHKRFSEEVQVVMVPQASFSATSGSVSLAIYYIMD